MLYREIIAICSEIHTKHINTLCGQNINVVVLNLAVQLSKHFDLKGNIQLLTFFTYCVF